MKTQSFEKRSGNDRRCKGMPPLSRYWFAGSRAQVRRREDRRGLHWADRYSARTLAVVLLIIFLSVLDAILTLNLINRGAVELNPVMAYYIEHSPVTFFWVKYFLTWSAVFILLLTKNVSLLNTKFQVKSLFIVSLVFFALVVQWELYLFFHHTY